MWWIHITYIITYILLHFGAFHKTSFAKDDMGQMTTNRLRPSLLLV